MRQRHAKGMCQRQSKPSAIEPGEREKQLFPAAIQSLVSLQSETIPTLKSLQYRQRSIKNYCFLSCDQPDELLGSLDGIPISLTFIKICDYL